MIHKRGVGVGVGVISDVHQKLINEKLKHIFFSSDRHRYLIFNAQSAMTGHIRMKQ